jgi:P27 family predicted phage terminase small subunit
MKGRKPKPAAMHRLTGTFQPALHAAREKAEPKPVGELHEAPPPDYLNEEARAVWDATLPWLPRGVVGLSDYDLLAHYCTQVATVRLAAAAQKALDFGKPMPMLAKSKDGSPMVSPYVRLIRQASMAAAQLGAELGLSPSARARIGSSSPPPARENEQDPEDPWSGFTGFAVVQGGRK